MLLTEAETASITGHMCLCNNTPKYLSGNYHICVDIGQQFLICHLENRVCVSMMQR
jgi:hypothetical protein